MQSAKTLYSWYKLVNEKWVDQSGYGVAIQHSIKCGSAPSTNIKRSFEAKKQEVPKPLPALANAWQKTVVELITSHPTLFISAGCDIICDAANFAARNLCIMQHDIHCKQYTI